MWVGDEQALFKTHSSELHSYSQEAASSIRFYQNIRATDNVEDDEKRIALEIDRLKGIINDLHTKSTENSFDWSELKTRVAQRALLIGLVLMVLYQFSGVTAMMSYTANIFKDAGSDDVNLAAIITGVIQLLGNCFATKFVDIAGRKVKFSGLNAKWRCFDA